MTVKQISGAVVWQAEGGTEIEVLQALLNRATELHASGWGVDEFYLAVRNGHPTALLRASFRGMEER